METVKETKETSPESKPTKDDLLKALEGSDAKKVAALIEKNIELKDLKVGKKYGPRLNDKTIVMLVASSLNVAALKMLFTYNERFKAEITSRNDDANPLFLAISATINIAYKENTFNSDMIDFLLHNDADKEEIIKGQNALEYYFQTFLFTAWNGIPPISYEKHKETINLLCAKLPITNGGKWLKNAFTIGYFCLARAILEVDQNTKQYLSYKDIVENIKSIAGYTEGSRDINALQFWIGFLYEKKSETTITLSDFQGTTPQKLTSPPETKEKTVIAEKIPHDIARLVQKAAEGNWNPIKKWAESTSKEASAHTRSGRINDKPTKLPPSTPTQSQFSWGNFSKTFSNFWKPSTPSSRSLSFGTPSKLPHTKDSRDNNSTIIHVRGLK